MKRMKCERYANLFTFSLKAQRITSVSVPFRMVYSATPVNMHENPINFISFQMIEVRRRSYANAHAAVYNS